jgi:hypothetical protein
MCTGEGTGNREQGTVAAVRSDESIGTALIKTLRCNGDKSEFSPVTKNKTEKGKIALDRAGGKCYYKYERYNDGYIGMFGFGRRPCVNLKPGRL